MTDPAATYNKRVSRYKILHFALLIRAYRSGLTTLRGNSTKKGEHILFEVKYATYHHVLEIMNWSWCGNIGASLLLLSLFRRRWVKVDIRTPILSAEHDGSLNVLLPLECLY